MPNAKIERWRSWCEGRLRDEIIVMHLHRHVVRELRRITDENGELPGSYFWQYLGETYTRTQASAIRRQVDKRNDVCSLARLLLEVGKDASLITKCLYVERRGADERVEAERRFGENFAGEDENYLNPAMVKHDRAALAALAQGVKDYTDEYVAHAKPEVTRGPPAFNELDFAIDGIGHFFNKYSEVIAGKSWPVLIPEFDHDWQAIFRVPWIR